MSVILLRGLPGSGKSTLRARRFPKVTTVSADDFWIRPDGSWVFDPARIGEAHAMCFRAYLEALRCFKDAEILDPTLKWTVIVDNTNTTDVEIAPYMLAAAAFKTDARIITLRCDPKLAFERNIHGVPEAVIKSMAISLEKPLPPWWTQEMW